VSGSAEYLNAKTTIAAAEANPFQLIRATSITGGEPSFVLPEGIDLKRWKVVPVKYQQQILIQGICHFCDAHKHLLIS